LCSVVVLTSAAVLGCGGGDGCPALSLDMQSLAAQAAAIDVDVYDANAACDGNDIAAGAPDPIVSRHLDGNAGTTLQLPAGNYVVVLHAFDAGGTFIGSACQADVFTPGQRACVSVALSAPAIDTLGVGDMGGGGTGGAGGGGTGGTGGGGGLPPFVTQTSGVTTTLYQAWAAGNGVVYAVGVHDTTGGVILKTTDSGTTWKRLNAGTTQDLEAVWGVDAMNVWAVGLRGTILRTTNGGTSWTNVGTGQTPYYDIWGTSANDVYVSGDSGVLVHSTTGSSFSQVSTTFGNSNPINCVWGTSASDVYLFGGSGTIMHGSASVGFDKQTSGTTDYLQYGWGSSTDVWIPSMNSTGSSSTLWHSTDHGATWTAQLTTATELWAVWSTPDADAFVVGSVIEESTDHGATWNVVATAPQILQGVGGDPATGEVWSVGYGGLIMYRHP